MSALRIRRQASEDARLRVISVRVSETGYEHITARAQEAGVDVSEMVRRMLGYAAQNMPRRSG